MKSDQDIETWYEEAKETAFKAYIKAIDTHVGEQERQHRFLLSMQKLHKEYDSKHHFSMKVLAIRQSISRLSSILLTPFVFLWTIVSGCFVFLWNVISNHWSNFVTSYKYGALLEKETKWYIAATRSEMKNLPLKKKRGAKVRPILLAFKRPLRRIQGKFRVFATMCLGNSKVNTKFYKENTLKFLSKLFAEYLKVQAALIKGIKFMVNTTKFIMQMPSKFYKWLKQKLNPEDL